MRTTVHIDDHILKDLKKIQQKEGKSLCWLISHLLAQAPWARKPGKGSTSQSRRISRTMGARIDLADRETLYAAMEQGLPPTEGAKET